jgi:hypothetical protein
MNCYAKKFGLSDKDCCAFSSQGKNRIWAQAHWEEIVIGGLLPKIHRTIKT